MSHQGANKCARVGALDKEQPWFKARRAKQKAREKMAKKSRRANRGGK